MRVCACVCVPMSLCVCPPARACLWIFPLFHTVDRHKEERLFSRRVMLSRGLSCVSVLLINITTTEGVDGTETRLISIVCVRYYYQCMCLSVAIMSFLLSVCVRYCTVDVDG